MVHGPPHSRAMRDGGLAPLGGEGKIVEADETYHGKIAAPTPAAARSGRPSHEGRQVGPAGKRAIVGLVERGGQVRTFHVAVADKATVGKIVTDNVAKESRLHTDESRLYGDADSALHRPRDREALGWRIRPL